MTIRGELTATELLCVMVFICCSKKKGYAAQKPYGNFPFEASDDIRVAPVKVWDWSLQGIFGTS